MGFLPLSEERQGFFLENYSPRAKFGPASVCLQPGENADPGMKVDVPAPSTSCPWGPIADTQPQRGNSTQ